LNLTTVAGTVWLHLKKSGHGEGAVQTSRVGTNHTNSAFNALSSFGVSKITHMYKRLKKLTRVQIISRNLVSDRLVYHN